MNKLSKILVSTTFLVALSFFGFGMAKGYGSATENITPSDRTSFENSWDDLGTTDGTNFTPTFDSSSNLRFSGTTFPFAEVELNLFSTQITGKTNADSKGAWEIVVKQAVATGDHTAYITTKTTDGKIYRAAKPYILSVNTSAKTVAKTEGVLIAQATTTPTVTTTTPTVTTAPKTTTAAPTPAVTTAPATAEAAATGTAVTTGTATSGTVATTGTVAGTTTTDAEDNKSKDSGNAFWWFIAGIVITIIAFRVFRKKGNDDLDLLMDKNAKLSKKEKKAVEKEEIEADEEEAETEDEEAEIEEEVVVAEPVKKVQPQQNQQKQNQNQQKKNKNRKSW